MPQIPLTQGQFALVDDADYDKLNQSKWCAKKECNGNFYAVRWSLKNGKQIKIRMSRQILGLEQGDSRQADHQNHNTLDDRRDNLRICTCRQNLRNRRGCSNTSSRFKGVHWEKQKKKWCARICINGKSNHLGRYDDEELAAMAYDSVARKVFGEFAYLNFSRPPLFSPRKEPNEGISGL